jgi:hypothetical protein
MEHGQDFQRARRMRGRYRPEHAWLGSPGDGPPIRARRVRRWHFRGRELRILCLAILIGALAWAQLG